MSGPYRIVAVAACSLALACKAEPAKPPVTVLQPAPGVYVRLASDEHKSNANQGWVVFDDHVLVVDAGVPPQAKVTIETIRRSTKLPIRHLVNTHHHGDHAYANVMFVEQGAEIIAAASGRELHESLTRPSLERVRERWDHVYPSIPYVAPSVWIGDRLTLQDGAQLVELLHMGHGHTPDDVLVWMPQFGILFAGDLVLNGPENFAGHADTAGWIRVLEQLQELPVRTVVPGHGPVGGPELLELQRRYLEETRNFVAGRRAAGLSREEIEREIELPFYEQWTGVPARERPGLVHRVYAELGGKDDGPPVWVD